MRTMQVPSTRRTSIDPLSDSSDSATWKPLRLLTIYRLLLTAILTLLFFYQPTEKILGSALPDLYRNTVLGYVVFSVVVAITSFRILSRFNIQVLVQIIGDILFITLLLHASGGISSGLGTVLVVALAAGGLLLPGKTAYWFAAVATVAILSETAYLALVKEILSLAVFAHAGLLGTAFFATAAMTHLLAQRAKESEALVARQEIDLANLTQLNEFVIQHMDTGVMVVDGKQTIRLVNTTAESVLDINGSCTNQHLEQVSPELQQQLYRWMAKPMDKPDLVHSATSGQKFLPRFQSLGDKPNAGVLIFLEDPSELAQQAQQLKLAAIGRLSANIAHEIRNPLGAISHAGQLLAESSHLAGNDRRMTEIIRDQCQRVNAIVESVLQLSRKQTPHGQLIIMQDWLGGFRDAICGQEDIESEQLTIAIAPADLAIHFDIGNLHQILWNICTNTLQHARPADGPVQLRVTGHVTDKGVPVLEIADNGIPITPDVQQRLFEPFYTSSVGGTGLGLYIARGLCENNQARLDFYTDPVNGNVFRIFFAKP